MYKTTLNKLRKGFQNAKETYLEAIDARWDDPDYLTQLHNERERKEEMARNQKIADRRINRVRLYVMIVLVVLIVTSVFMFHAAVTTKTEKRNKLIFTIAGWSLVVASVAIFVMYLQIIEKLKVLQVVGNLIGTSKHDPATWEANANDSANKAREAQKAMKQIQDETGAVTWIPGKNNNIATPLPPPSISSAAPPARVEKKVSASQAPTLPPFPPMSPLIADNSNGKRRQQDLLRKSKAEARFKDAGLDYKRLDLEVPAGFKSRI